MSRSIKLDIVKLMVDAMVGETVDWDGVGYMVVGNDLISVDDHGMSTTVVVFSDTPDDLHPEFWGGFFYMHPEYGSSVNDAEVEFRRVYPRSVVKQEWDDRP